MTEPLENTLVEPQEPDASLGSSFWIRWVLAMAGTFAAFGAVLWFTVPNLSGMERTIGVGATVIAFTLALAWGAGSPQRERLKRGIGEPMRAPYRRYLARFLPAMFAYAILLMGAISYSKDAAPEGALAWLVAIAPAIPLIFAVRAIFLLPVEEDDEYQRQRIYQAYAWATGATLMACTVVGFLGMFGVIPQPPLWVAFPAWAIFMGIARCLPLGGQK